MAVTLHGDFRYESTPRFLMAFEEGVEDEGELGAKLEEACEAVLRFCRLMRLDIEPLGRKLEVVVFRDRAGYERYASAAGVDPAGTSGVYLESLNRSVIHDLRNDPELRALEAELVRLASHADRMRETIGNLPDGEESVEIRHGDGRRVVMTRDAFQMEMNAVRQELDRLDAARRSHLEEVGRVVIVHEAVHQVLFNVGVHVPGAKNPRWLVEGLACLLEADIGTDGDGVGRVNSGRLADFAAAVARSPARHSLTEEDLLEAVDAGRVPSPGALVADPSLFRERGSGGSAVYATAWVMTHHLFHTERAGLARYMTEMSQRAPGAVVSAEEERAVFERHFGPCDQRMLQRWGTYLVRPSEPGARREP